MIVFPRMAHKAIRSGQVTLTFRLWDSCRLEKGRSYRLEEIGQILIKGTRRIPVSSITDEEALRAGYASLEKLISNLQRKKPDLDREKDLCFRIEFKYLGQESKGKYSRPPRPLSPAILDKIDQRVKRMDRRAQGVTYSAMLKEMSRHSFIKVANLMDRFDRDYPEIRRKLRKLADERLVEIDPRRRFYLTTRGRQFIEYRTDKLSGKKK